MRERAALSRQLAELEVATVLGDQGACLPRSPWPDMPCPDAKPSPARASRRISLLTEVIWRDLQTLQQRPTTVLFNGSYDWHSSVHAHWALLSIARVTNHAGLEKALASRMTEDKLQKEMAYLKANPSFERPYGRAWLWLMLSELARHPWRPKSTPSMLDTIEAERLAWLEKAPFPEFKSAKSSRFFWRLRLLAMRVLAGLAERQQAL